MFLAQSVLFCRVKNSRTDIISAQRECLFPVLSPLVFSRTMTRRTQKAGEQQVSAVFPSSKQKVLSEQDYRPQSTQCLKMVVL